MRRHLPSPAWFAANVAVVVALGAPAPQIPQFRAGVTLVPVEVSVIDEKGQPVEDLSARDFGIREDGVPQQITHFEVLNRTTIAAPRTFMIVLGRGYLDKPTNALQALIDFVHRAAPTDRIGVAAYLRVLPVSVDHQAVERFLSLFGERHKTIENMVARDDSTAWYDHPARFRPETRTAIDRFFQDSGVQTLDFAGSMGSTVSRYDNFRYLVDVVDFYLRKVDGEKDTIVVTERPFGAGVPSKDPRDDFWVRKAAAARTALIFINAGGLKGQTLYRGGGFPKYQWVGAPLPPLLGDFVREGVDRLDALASETGGLSSFFELADKPLTLLDRATQSGYLLGYYPAAASTATQVRLIDVRVTRPGVRLFYRHAYQAEPGPDDPQEYRKAVTSARVELAADLLVHPYERPPDGFRPAGITWGNRVKILSASDTQASVSFSFDPTWITFVQHDGVYAADLDLVLLADDPQRNVVGRKDLKLTLRLTAAEFQRTKREWLKYDAVVDVTARPAYVRSVLYDFIDDRTGSTQVTVPPRS